MQHTKDCPSCGHNSADIMQSVEGSKLLKCENCGYVYFCDDEGITRSQQQKARRAIMLAEHAGTPEPSAADARRAQVTQELTRRISARFTADQKQEATARFLELSVDDDLTSAEVAEMATIKAIRQWERDMKSRAKELLETQTSVTPSDDDAWPDFPA